jgi:hypothetical protein
LAVEDAEDAEEIDRKQHATADANLPVLTINTINTIVLTAEESERGTTNHREAVKKA